MVMRMFSRNLGGSKKKDGDSNASESELSTRSPVGVIKKKTSMNLGSARIKKNESVESDQSDVDAQKIAEEFAKPPALPNPVRQEQLVDIRGARRDGPVQVSDTLNLFVSTWNMAGCTVLPTSGILMNWLPTDYDLYAIALQNSRSVKQMQEKILEFLGDDFQSFKYILMGQNSLLLFARSHYVSSGVLAPTRLNDLVKFEVKSKSLVGGATGRGCILMQVVFHNTTLAFVAVNLDDDLDGLDRRKADLDFCFKASGIQRAETNEIGTPVLTAVQHVFLFGNFGIKTLDKCQGASKHTWKGKWSQLLYPKEFEEMSKACPSMEAFEELEVNYPPTSRRRVVAPTRGGDGGSMYSVPPASPRGAGPKVPESPRGASKMPESPRGPGMSIDLRSGSFSLAERRLSATFISQFAREFEIETLYEQKLVKKEGEPSYEDRVFYRTNESQKHLMEPGIAGTAEMVRLGTHVPVYSTFRLCGLDSSLLKRWQVITGNLPVEHATRTDFRMVKGVVDDLMGLLNEKAHQEEELEKMKQGYLAQMRSCDRCMEPLSLEGGDVDMGDQGVYHRKCFTCEDCGKDLMEVQVMLADGKWLCIDSFNRIYRSDCPACSKPIHGERVRVGKDLVSYHLPCFSCCLCGTKLVEHGSFKDFMDMDGKPYCAADFEKVKDQCCGVCKKSIKEDEKAESGARFHRACYKCAVCGQDMDKTNMRAVVRDFKVFCEVDHLKDVLANDTIRKLKKTREEEKIKRKEEEEEDRKKEQEMMKRRISMIPKGFDLSTFDVPEDDDIAEEDEDD